MAQTRTPVPPAGDDDTELIAAVLPTRRPLATTLALIGGAALGLAVVAGIIVSVVTMSAESNRPAPQAPLTPISRPAHTTTAAPEPSTTVAASSPALPVAPLPPVTATAQTITAVPLIPPQPSDGPRVRDRLHELFPRLFPENP